MKDESDSTSVARLLVEEGSHAGTIFPLYERQVLIGRLRSSDLPLDDGSVSRLHARVFFRGGCAYIEDLGSRWGTLVNGAPVEGHRPLAAGDIIQVGSVRLRFEP